MARIISITDINNPLCGLAINIDELKRDWTYEYSFIRWGVLNTIKIERTRMLPEHFQLSIKIGQDKISACINHERMYEEMKKVFEWCVFCEKCKNPVVNDPDLCFGKYCRTCVFKATFTSLVKETETCSICMSPMHILNLGIFPCHADKFTIRKVSCCGNFFHTPCLDKIPFDGHLPNCEEGHENRMMESYNCDCRRFRKCPLCRKKIPFESQQIIE